jgi:pilus assembly protein Flp/PilA
MCPSALLQPRCHADHEVMTTNFVALLRHLHVGLRDEDGQTMAEYGILIAVIALIVVLAATLLGGQISSLFGSAGSTL